MVAVLDKDTSPGNRGSHHSEGCEYLYYVNDAPAQIWRQPINPATLIVQQSTRVLVSGQSNNLNSLGAGDLRWVGGSKQVQAQNGAKVVKLTGFTALAQIPPEDLAGVAWDSVPTNNAVGNEDGLSTIGNFYAVRIPVAGGDPHYAKVRIFRDGVTKLEWDAYIVGTRPSVIHTLGAELAAPRDLFVNEHETEIYVSGGAGAAGYVVKFPRIVGGPFPQYLNSPIALNDPSSSVQLFDPRQMLVDANSIYVVAEGGLFLIQPEHGVQVQVVSGISAPVGLLLNKQQRSVTAYISTLAGQVYVVDVSGFNAPMFDDLGNQAGVASAPIPAGAPSAALALGGPSGFLTWANDAHTAFYAAIGGASGRVQYIDLVSSSVADELTAGDPELSNPWSIEVLSEGSLTVVCDAAIYDVDRGISLTSDLALGLGFIPFDYINRSEENPAVPGPIDGRADTSAAPGYYFSAYPNLAFGGSLSLLIDHQAAWSSGLRFYKVSLTNGATGQSRVITNPFDDLRWRSTARPPRFERVSIGVEDGVLFRVRSPSELWRRPHLAGIINTTLSDNGHNRLRIELFDANKSLVAGVSCTRLIFIDNTRGRVSLTYLRRGTPTLPPLPGDYLSPDDCGLIAYDSKDDLIAVDLVATHPSGGRYEISFARGQTPLFSATGALTASATLLTIGERSPGVPLRIGHLTGSCDIADITVRLRASSPGAIDGYGWVDQGAYTCRSFRLARSPLLHTPWPAAVQPARSGW